MHRNQHKATGSLIIKVTWLAPVTDPKDRELYELSHKEFKITLLKQGQLKDTRKTVHEQYKKFNKETETIKKNPRVEE